MSILNFGKYKGSKITEVLPTYLLWLAACDKLYDTSSLNVLKFYKHVVDEAKSILENPSPSKIKYKFTFGTYKDKDISECPLGYLKFICDCENFNERSHLIVKTKYPEAITNVKNYIEDKIALYTSPPPKFEVPSVNPCVTLEDLEQMSKEELINLVMLLMK